MNISIQFDPTDDQPQLKALAAAILKLAGEPCAHGCAGHSVSDRHYGGAEEVVITPPPSKSAVAADVTPPPVVATSPASTAERCHNCGFYGSSCQCDTASFDDDGNGDVQYCSRCGMSACICGQDIDTSKIFAGQLGNPLPAGATPAAPAPSSVGADPTQNVATVTPPAQSPAVNVPPVNVPNGAAPVNGAPMGVPNGNPAVGVEVDTKGMPWDGRIHARTKAKVADGTWRQKRGVAADLIAQVEAELRAANAAPAATVQTTSVVDPNPTVPEFTRLMIALTPFLCTDAEPNKPLSQSGLRQWAAHIGLINPATNEGEVRMLEARPDLIPQFRAVINRHLAQWNQSIGD